jgi:glycosyltransferase involved in cell wall biosynthesis
VEKNYQLKMREDNILRKIKYIAVCAARNEEKYIAYSISSVLNQNHPPEICILSDDGSTDDTPNIAKKNGAIIYYNKKHRYKMRGVNQVLALNSGITIASNLVTDWDYLLKFDADTIIPDNYVKHIITIMEKNPSLGVCAGKPENENMRLARASDAAKIYRRKCWEDIQGLDIWIAFDSHALIKAAQAGWVTQTIPSVTFKELRPSGKYGLTRWILTGFERASFGFPLYHTVMASIKNIKWGSPPILNVLATIFSHILNPWPKAPNLDHLWVKRYAINEIRYYLKEILGLKHTHANMIKPE